MMNFLIFMLSRVEHDFYNLGACYHFMLIFISIPFGSESHDHCLSLTSKEAACHIGIIRCILW